MSFRALLCAVLLLLCSNAISSAQVVDCDWTNHPCTDPWVSGTEEISVSLGTTPPCEVKMRVHYKKRCLQVEIQDWTVGPFITTPPGCADQDDFMSALSSGSLSASIYAETIGAILHEHIVSNPSCCDCQNGYSQLFTAKVANCYRPILTYTLPDQTQTSQFYDASVAWSQYELQMQIQGGFDPIISIESCPGTGCCIKSRVFCKNSQGEVEYWDETSYTFGECGNDPEGQCYITFCDF